MTIVKVNPASSTRLLNEFDPFFQAFFGHDLPASYGREALRNSPSVNVLEKKDRFEVALAAPGLTKSDFSVTVEKGILTIKVEKEPAVVEGETVRRREFSYHNFTRRFQLPDTVEGAGVEATYEQGILTVVLPKRQEVLPRTIEIA